MRVLVTGGAGFIGSHSVEELMKAGHFVRVIDNLSTGKLDYLSTRGEIEVLREDIRDGDALARAMRGITHVLHLAAQVSVQRSIDHPLESFGNNATGFMNVMEAARKTGVQRFVYASSAAVYGLTGQGPVDETTAPAPLSPYGLEKLVNDQFAAMYGTLYGMSCIGLRYFNAYGPRQDPASPYAGVISKFCERVRLGQPLVVFGDGLQTRDFVHVHDIAEINRLALVSKVEGVLNVGTGRSVSLLELIDTLAECFGRRPPIRHEPARTGDIVHSSMRVDRLVRELGKVPSIRLFEGLSHLVAEQLAGAAYAER